ncbi:hypothetical protein H0H92_014428 [Tricholoma furcatifolium]|nr:hypothetical protein H0H92_014428 [Tricholoma furcatifolium]
MAIRSPSITSPRSSDPYQLERLADELASRESAVSTSQNGHLDVHNLPDFVPLSHDNPFLTDPHFKVEEFLLSRSNTSLPDLRSELREYLSQLKEELVKLINDDYEAFISLSTDLRDEGDRLQRLKTPLGGLKLAILQSRMELQILQEAIKEKLDKRAALREEKAILHLLLKLSESVTRLESLLLISHPEHATIGSADSNPLISVSQLDKSEESVEHRSRDNRAKHLGRIAAEYMQLLYHASKARADKCVFVDEMQWRIDRIQSTISSDLDHVFAQTLVALTDGKGEGRVAEVEKTKLLADVMECLRTYDILGLWRDAEDVLRKEVVRGFTIYHGALAAPHSPIVPHTPFPAARAPSQSLSTPLPRTPYTPFTALVPARHNTPFSLGSSSPYAYLLEDSDDSLARLYSQALRFVERDLSRIMSIAESVSIKPSPPSQPEKELSLSDFQRECTANEFNILANVIWEEFGRALVDELGGIIFASGRPDEFRKNLELSQAFIRSLEYLAPSARSVKAMRAHPTYVAFEQRWQLPVYFQLRWKEIITPLEDLLTTTRIEPTFSQDKTSFATRQANAVWVLEIDTADSLVPKHEGNVKSLAGLGVDKNPTSPSQPRASTPVQPHDISSSETLALDDATIRQNVALIADIETLRVYILTLWREEISIMLPESPTEDESGRSDAQEALHNVLSGITDLITPLSVEIIAILTKRCCDALLPVRSIPSQFRAMSTKRIPNEPSYFVASILRPLKVFFGIGVGDGTGIFLGENHIQPYCSEVFENVVQRYIYYLAAMKKTEESLRRLKKGKKTTFSLFGSASANDDDSKDEERIRIQMILDVDAFGKDGEALGVVLARSEAYSTLKDMVQALDAPES